MAKFAVCYDLKTNGHAYSGLFDAIKALSPHDRLHSLDSTWILIADATAVQIRDALAPHIGDGDRLLVIEIGGGELAWKGFPRGTTEWLNSRWIN